ncbi:hypothetical protein LINGRAHAP2_LOCUS36003 [Linum grandiflorum]
MDIETGWSKLSIYTGKTTRRLTIWLAMVIVFILVFILFMLVILLCRCAFCKTFLGFPNLV